MVLIQLLAVTVLHYTFYTVERPLLSLAHFTLMLRIIKIGQKSVLASVLENHISVDL